MYWYWWDSTYFLVIIGVIICGWASINVKATFNKYNRMYSSQGYTAQAVAELILRNAGLTNIRIEHVRGSLTDHYDPSAKVLRLSDSVYGSSSVAAIGVAAHECGHAIQDQVSYAPLKLRNASFPITRIGSTLAWPVIIIGIILGMTGLARIGVVLFTFVVFFQLVTLPVEFDASKRAMAILSGNNILVGEELTGAGKMLKAAALTYVAALLSSILQLIRLIAITNRD